MLNVYVSTENKYNIKIIILIVVPTGTVGGEC